MYIILYIDVYHVYTCIYTHTYMHRPTYVYVALSRIRPFTHSQIQLHKITQQTPLPRGTADMSAVGHNGNVCYVTQQTSRLGDTADMSAA